MDAPKPIVRAAAGYLHDFPKAKLVFLGKYKDALAYYVKLPSDMIVGYPPVYLYKDAKVRPIYGEDALDIITSF